MLNEQIVVVMISSVFLGFQTCILGIVLYNQIRERREVYVPPPQEEILEEEEQVEEQAEEQAEEQVEEQAEAEDTDDDMPGLIRLDSVEPPAVSVVENPPFSTIIAPITSIYMDMVPSLTLEPKNTQLPSPFDALSTNKVVFAYLDKDLA